MIYKIQYKSFSFGSNIPLNNTILDSLIKAFSPKQDSDLLHLNFVGNVFRWHSKSRDKNKKNQNFQSVNKISKPVLNGRGVVKYIKIPEIGYIVVKEYKRGGLIHYFNKNIYINLCGKTRSQREFEMLFKAKKAGINVPEPVVYASKGSIFYKAWLVTKKINKCQNFADLSLKDKKKAAKIFPEISKNIKKLIENNIYHVDLHPGNILIDINNENYIIDFDKAFIFRGTKDNLINLYKKRWARAVLKYHLPENISVPELI